MTSKPTARERFKELKKLHRYDDATLDFLFELVEAATSVAAIHFNSEEKDFEKIQLKVWNRINQRMAQGKC